MKKRWLTLLSVLIITAALGLSGCGASNSSDSYSLQTAAETRAAEMAEAPAPAGAPAMGTKSEERGTVPNSGMEPGSLTGPDGVSPLPASNRKLIRNVSMNVETDAFETLVPALNGKIAELGGYVEQSDISGSHLNSLNELSPRYASITARIPSQKLDGFIRTVEENGNVVNKSETTTDVTLQYSDIESRKKTLEVEQERLWALLEKAESMDAVVTLEQRLSEIRYELESMGSQLRLYDNQVDYSTVYLHISEVRDFTPVQPESVGQRIQNGFVQNARAVSKGLTSLLVSILALSPVWAPVLLAVLAVLYLVRRRRKKTPRPEKTGRKKKEQEEDKGADGQ